MVIVKGSPMLADDINNLTFFPKGTVLMYSSSAWNGASAEFKEIWHICNGDMVDGYKTLNLVNNFVRGSTSSGQYGGSDTKVAYHTHGVTESDHTHIQNSHSHSFPSDSNGQKNTSGATRHRGDGGSTSYTRGETATNQYARTNLTINYAGNPTDDNKPAYCTVIFIEKVV